ncbi:hypothetical protein BSKO_03637 [Bryopsis sp. KO-2023]|nr:hypothetical protein BSKO_03637 [Bryopsis sp. KO-2023]
MRRAAHVFQRLATGSEAISHCSTSVVESAATKAGWARCFRGGGVASPWLTGQYRALSGEAKSRFARRGPVSYLSLALTLATGGALLYYHNLTKQKKIDELLKTKDQSYGKTAMGGPFQLIDHNGKKFTEKNLLGEFALLYFGFTHCPDICPDELEKLTEALRMIEKECGAAVQPVFISVDPERDSVKQVKSYLKDPDSGFHPRLIGLTGSKAQVEKAAKAYRVYYVKADEYQGDYLVDHSIIMYLVNPEGDFVTFYGKNNEAKDLAKSMQGHIKNWAREHEEYSKDHPKYTGLKATAQS